MARAKSSKYTVVWANGDVTIERVPSFFTPYEVAARLPHSLLFLHVPKGHKVWDERAHGWVTGPCAVLLHDEHTYYAAETAPESEGHAYRLYKEINSTGLLCPL